MDTKTKLENALKEAMRAGDQVKKRTVRMALAAIKQAEVDRQVSLDEAAVLAILQKEIKTRRESLEEARKANRPDLVAAAEAEIAVVNAFLPQALSADELKALVEAAIAEAGAASPSDMGKVMKLLVPRIQGRAPGDQVSQLVRQLLHTQYLLGAKHLLGK
ncbi:MAG: GatB/YqeY domain-containing protein [Chloroflexi bacterium]|nr:GatB/YqeY domain-containing protein [Chloroflexota bacterium]